jgi:hypothetical protein
MKTTVYVVTMHRWGDKESHNYVQGVFTKKAQAQKCCDAERSYRGCKYEPKITEVILDQHDEDSLNYHKRCQ